MTEVRGFARNKDEAAWLKKHGVPDKAVYQIGRGAEDLDECLVTFRGRPGKLIIAHDLRVFGQTKKIVADTMARLEKTRIRVVDISHPGDVTVAEMLHRALVAISGYRFRDKRTARRRGRDGGRGKGLAAEQARAGLAPDWLIRNIVAETAIAWAVKVRILGDKFSASTLRRHYGAGA